MWKIRTPPATTATSTKVSNPRMNQADRRRAPSVGCVMPNVLINADASVSNRRIA